MIAPIERPANRECKTTVIRVAAIAIHADSTPRLTPAALNATSRLGARHTFGAGWLILLAAFLPALCQACPFCTAIKPTLAQRRESADVLLLGEFLSSEGDQNSFRIHQHLKKHPLLADIKRLEVSSDMALKPGTLVLLFGKQADEKDNAFDWELLPVNETSYAYLAKAPGLRMPPVERLPYFVRFLEHPDPLIAEDAYNEFGHAPYDDVARIADKLPAAKLRAWLVDANIPAARKGFYGLAVGLAGDDEDRAAGRKLLRRLILQTGDDYREGFDGVLGGYLIAEGEAALDLIELCFLANPQAADGDLRHVRAALRFCYEFNSKIPAARLRQAMRRFLDREEFAPAAIIDLARWQDWEVLPRIEQLYRPTPSDSDPLRRAVVGYLRTCPEPAADEALARLRQRDPTGVGRAEQSLSLFGAADR